MPLGTLGVKQFSEAGAVSNIKTPFTLTLEACGPTFAGVKIRFSGTPDDENPQLLKVADGGATGVAVLADEDGAGHTRVVRAFCPGDAGGYAACPVLPRPA